jgi:hypothetical protein
MPGPRLTAPCARHGIELPLCDACASVPAMARWAVTLTGYQLADALETMARDYRYYAPAEAKAILIEAARRARPACP